MSRRQVQGVLVSMLALTAPVKAQETVVVTLQQARERAISIAPQTVAARGQIATSAWERRAAYSAWYTPSLTAATSYTSFSNPFFNSGTGGINSQATSATLQASYTLLGGGKLSEVKRARASFESAVAAETATEFRVALAIDAAYYGVLADRELSRVANDRLRRAQEALDLARVRVRSGAAIATDSLQLLLEVNRAKLALLQRDSALRVARLKLGSGIGLTGPADAAPIDTIAPQSLPFTQEQAVAELRERGPELNAARAAEKSATARLGSEREAYWPQIAVSALTGTYDSQLLPSALSRSQFAVTVTLPIWNAGQRELSIARAQAGRSVARAERDERERSAAEVMAAAYNGYETARASIELAQVGIVAATENYRVQRARYREGATTTLDMLEAQLALSQAEATLVQSRYAARLALAQVEALLGRRIHTP
jgi:outer membrane protein TolC